MSICDGVLLFGPAVATHRFFDTLNKIERRLNDSGTPTPTDINNTRKYEENNREISIE